MAEAVALAALVLDAAWGWPAWLYRRIGHPVGAFARIIALCERRWNLPTYSECRRRTAGVATLLLLVLAGGGAGWAIQWLAHAALGPAGWIVVALCAFPGLAQHSLYCHVRAVAGPLAVGDLPAARRAVGMIVGRDTATLDDAGIARAALESLAESFCDGVAAPLFWLLVGGLPGLWAYKAVNTADSLIGHPEPPLRAFGWAAARTDDCVNWLPARIAGVLLCCAGGGGWRIMARDHACHASPNGGWPEAAMAGALRVRLAGPVSYDGVAHDKPWIGDGAAPDARAVRTGLWIYARACLMLWMIAGGCAWLV